MRTIILDNEAVHALTDPGDSKHRSVLAHLQAVAHRRKKGAAVQLVVPTAVRVEAGWDRSNPGSAAINRFPVVDAALDARAANLGAEIAVRIGASVADCHTGAVARLSDAEDLVVLTSDPGDMVAVSAPQTITAIRI